MEEKKQDKPVNQKRIRRPVIRQSDNIGNVGNIEISDARRDFLNKKRSELNRKISYKKENRKTWPKVIMFVVMIGVVFAAVSVFFHKVDVEVERKQESVVFSNEIYFAQVGQNNISEENKNDMDLSIAEGKIKIYNDSKKSIDLVKNTRFQINDLVFKIYKKISVPASSSVITDVYATETGSKFLIKKGVRLKVPGFKEAKMESEYNNVYGEPESDFVLKNKEKIKKKAIKVDSNLDNLEVVNYQIFETSAELQEEIQSLGVEEVEEKSSGKVKIINDTSRTQKLIKLTRFENNGMVFKINKSVTILPNSSTVVDVYASEAGEKYNLVKGLRFNIPGFKEAKMMDRYKNIYGNSISDFTGGKIQKENVPNKDDLANAKITLMQKLKEELSDKNRELIFNNYLLINTKERNITYKFENISFDDKIIVKAKATERGLIISKEDFMQSAWKSGEITKEDLKGVEVQDIHKLEVKVLDSETIDTDSNNSFKFSVNGKVNIVWKFNEQLFKDLIKGKDHDTYINQVKTSFSKLEKTTFNIFPFWRNSIPNDVDKINITIKK